MSNFCINGISIVAEVAAAGRPRRNRQRTTVDVQDTFLTNLFDSNVHMDTTAVKYRAILKSFAKWLITERPHVILGPNTQFQISELREWAFARLADGKTQCQNYFSTLVNLLCAARTQDNKRRLAAMDQLDVRELAAIEDSLKRLQPKLTDHRECAPLKLTNPIFTMSGALYMGFSVKTIQLTARCWLMMGCRVSTLTALTAKRLIPGAVLLESSMMKHRRLGAHTMPIACCCVPPRVDSECLLHGSLRAMDLPLPIHPKLPHVICCAAKITTSVVRRTAATVIALACEAMAEAEKPSAQLIAKIFWWKPGNAHQLLRRYRLSCGPQHLPSVLSYCRQLAISTKIRGAYEHSLPATEIQHALGKLSGAVPSAASQNLPQQLTGPPPVQATTQQVPDWMPARLRHAMTTQHAGMQH